MRNKLSLLVLPLVLGTGLGWAAPPTTDTQAMANIQSRLNHTQLQKHGDVQVTYAGASRRSPERWITWGANSTSKRPSRRLVA